jgi:hypothetical protein
LEEGKANTRTGLLPHSAPNNRLQLTASSVRCAPASGSS